MGDLGFNKPNAKNISSSKSVNYNLKQRINDSARSNNSNLNRSLEAYNSDENVDNSSNNNSVIEIKKIKEKQKIKIRNENKSFSNFPNNNIFGTFESISSSELSREFIVNHNDSGFISSVNESSVRERNINIQENK